jgi:transaldolase
MANPLVRLQQLGQSPWHDNIRRQLLTSGALKKMVEDGDITGLTSNPTIFEQAIGGSTDYDKDLHRLAREGRTADQIFDALAIDDIKNAADVLAPVFERTGRKDGYVSIEVAPRLANDTPSTVREARRLWSTVNRSNLMVKIPATAAGVPAIEQSIADGLSINVTLIFSLKRYDEVMDAYLRGLIRRLENGQKIDRIASVASFFVSRVDTLVDQLLEERIVAGAEKKDLLQSLKGKAAIANAKLAYAEFRRKFSTEAFAGLKNHGANLQRPLWASTSTKNPAYPDVFYVEALVGPDTVDTMPPATLVAYKDHGDPQPRLANDLDDARRVMDQLAEVGVSMEAVTKKLEEDGVASFTKSFDSLIAVVEKRRLEALAAGAAIRTEAAPKRTQGAAKRKTSPRATRARRAAKKSTARKPRKAVVKKQGRAKARSKVKSVAKARRKPTRTARRSSAKRAKRR